jgi:hypothetical protein
MRPNPSRPRSLVQRTVCAALLSVTDSPLRGQGKRPLVRRLFGAAAALLLLELAAFDLVGGPVRAGRGARALPHRFSHSKGKIHRYGPKFGAAAGL